MNYYNHINKLIEESEKTYKETLQLIDNSLELLNNPKSEVLNEKQNKTR